MSVLLRWYSLNGTVVVSINALQISREYFGCFNWMGSEPMRVQTSGVQKVPLKNNHHPQKHLVWNGKKYIGFFGVGGGGALFREALWLNKSRTDTFPFRVTMDKLWWRCRMQTRLEVCALIVAAVVKHGYHCMSIRLTLLWYYWLLSGGV